jgi:hypothetical protein
MARKKITTQVTQQRPEAAHRFDARLFAAVAVFMAKTDVRYCLNGVCFIPHPQGGALLAATDGHQLGIAYDPNGRAESEMIVSISSAALVAARRHKFGTVYVQDDRVIIADNLGIEAYIQPGKSKIEGKFPNVFGRLPKAGEEVPAGMCCMVSPLLMARIGEASKILAATLRFGTGMKCWQSNTNGVIYTRLTAEEHFLIMTMPMRDDLAAKTPVPTFIAAAKPAPKEAPVPQQPSDAAPPAEAVQAPAPAPAPEPVAAQAPAPAAVAAPAAAPAVDVGMLAAALAEALAKALAPKEAQKA